MSGGSDEIMGRGSLFYKAERVMILVDYKLEN